MNSVAELPIHHLNELPDLAKFLLNFAGDTKHFLFYGPMGVGKTTLIKELCLALGSEDNFSSPTYAIVNEYASEKNGRICHFDLYRVKTREELLDLGIEEYLNTNDFCFFEWPELVEEFIGKGYLKIEMEMADDNRYLKATKY